MVRREGKVVECVVHNMKLLLIVYLCGRGRPCVPLKLLNRDEMARYCLFVVLQKNIQFATGNVYINHLYSFLRDNLAAERTVHCFRAQLCACHRTR